MGQDHYLAIDIGGSKTLFAVFEAGGKLIFDYKLETPQNYEQFKMAVGATLRKELGQFQFSHCCCAVPGWIDFKLGIAVGFGNLPWENVHIKKDLEEIMPHTQLLIHNDAKLAGLSEAHLLEGTYSKVLYLTVSTGIGGGIIVDGYIDPNFANFEPGQMKFEFQGQSLDWEDFASGRALVQKYGKLASQLEDEPSWREFSQSLAIGLEVLLATIQPDVVVIGGGVGAHFEKFKDFLEQDLKTIKNPLVPIPPLVKAHRPEEAVIYGCYDYIRQTVQ